MYINNKNIDQDIISLRETGLLIIKNFFEHDFAEKIYNCLINDVDWGLSCKVSTQKKHGEVFLKTNDVSDLELSVLQKLKDLQSTDNFQYIYNTYMMVAAYIDKRDPDLFLNTVLEWLNSMATLRYFKKLTQSYNIKKISAQATRYLPGHFLTRHSDKHDEEGRLYAMIIGFSKDWNPDWGGLLNIMNKDGEIVSSLIPEYNCLTLMKVPQDHFVSMVSPLALNQRLAITGWLLDS